MRKTLRNLWIQIYVIFLACVLPLSMPQGYFALGEHKSITFIIFSYFCFVIVSILSVPEMISWAKNMPKSMDCLFLLFGIAHVLSFLFSPYQEIALLGMTGWRMGILSQFCYIMLFILFSNRFSLKKWYCLLFAGTAILVETLAIINLCGNYPATNRESGYLATIGNSDWFIGYLSVFYSFSVILLLYAIINKKTLEMIGLCIWVAMGSTSLLLAKNDSAKVLLAISWATAFLVIIVTDKRTPRTAKKTTQCMLGWITVFPAMFLLFQMLLVDILPDTFGNGRGFIWKVCRDAWMELPLKHKILGIGQDSISAYLYDEPNRAMLLEARYGRIILSNAHSDLLSRLLQTGILGITLYLSIIIWLVLLFFRAESSENKDMQRWSGVFLAPALVYGVLNTVLFEQALSTPYFYLMLALSFGVINNDPGQEE